MRIIHAVLFMVLLSSCDGGGLIGNIDHFSFCKWGTTIFTDPQQVSLKEIHLDTGNLLGRTIVIEGKLQDIGKHLTHIVVDDNTARMLVVLTHMRSAEEKIGNTPPKMVKILGVVERGKKGLPYVSAIAINKEPNQKPS